MADMSDVVNAQKIAGKWGDFQEEVDQIPRMMQKLTHKEAVFSCLECRGTTFEKPGCKGWGTM